MKKILLLLILILSISLVNGDTENYYPNTAINNNIVYNAYRTSGSDDLFYNGYDGSSIGSASNVYKKSFSIAEKGFTSPIVADLDSDGNNEIIISDGTYIRILNFDENSKSLTQLSSYDFGQSVLQYIVGDFYNNNSLSIIVERRQGSTSGRIFVGSFNGTELDFNYWNSTIYSGRDVDVYDEQIGSSFICGYLTSSSEYNCFSYKYLNTTHIEYLKFNNTFNRSFTYDFPTTDYPFLSSRGSSYAMVDVYGSGSLTPRDGYKEIIHGYSYIVGSNIKSCWAIFSPNTNTFSHACRTYYTPGEAITSPSNAEIYHTLNTLSPLVINIDGASSNGYELMFPVCENRATEIDYNCNSFKIYSYKNDGTLIESYPAIANIDADIVSPPVLGQCNSDYISDYQFAVFFSRGGKLGVVCVVENAPLDTSYTSTSDLESSLNYTNYNLATDSGFFKFYYNADSGRFFDAYSSITVDCSNEILSSGCDISRDWLYSVGLGFGIPIDYQYSSFADILGMTNSEFYYLEDGLSNSYPVINDDNSYFNPCISEGIIKTGSDIRASLEFCDDESDDMSIRAYFYYNQPFEQNETYNASPVGGCISHDFWFVANQSGHYDFLVEVTDSKHTSYYELLPVSYYVASNGFLEYGSTTCNTEYELVITASSDASTIQDFENQIKEDLKTLPSGDFLAAIFSIGLVFLIISAYAIYKIAVVTNGNGAAIVIMAIFLLFMGYKIAVVDVSFIILMAVGLVTVGIIIFARKE